MRAREARTERASVVSAHAGNDPARKIIDTPPGLYPYGVPGEQAAATFLDSFLTTSSPARPTGRERHDPPKPAWRACGGASEKRKRAAPVFVAG